MKCENCEKDHDGSYGSGRFCSSKCARGFATKIKRAEINEKIKNISSFHCDICDKNFIGKQSYSGHRAHCGKIKDSDMISKRIEKQSKSLRETNRIKRERDVLLGIASVDRCRTYLIETHGNICMECGLIEWRGKEMVKEIHHIDGNDENNNINNIILLCPNCHYQTNNHRFKGRTHTK